jgi:hypothetical protein
MWLSLVWLVSALGSSTPDAIPALVSQDCLVIGKVFNTSGKIGATLYSNCPLSVERKPRILIMKGRHRHIEVRLPDRPGVHDFVYRWGESTARVDNEQVEIAFGPANET